MWPGVGGADAPGGEASAPALDGFPQELAVGDLVEVDRRDDGAHLGPHVK